MKNFQSGGRGKERGFNGRSSFGGDKRGAPSFGGRNDRGDRRESGAEMFTATCSTCGKSCEVPFKPTGDRPVFCRDCFGRKDEGYNRNTPSDIPKREARRDDRPVVRDERTATQAGVRPDPSLIEIKQKLTLLEGKLNRILDLINPPQPKVRAEVSPAVIAEVPKVAALSKVVKPKAVVKVVVKKAVVKKAVVKKALAKKVMAKPTAKKKATK